MLKIFLAATLFTSQFLGTALACTCAPPGSPLQEAAKSLNTFAGTVISIETISPPPPRRAYLFEEFFNDVHSLLTGKTIRPLERFDAYQVVTFQVSRTFRGSQSPIRRINTGPVESTCSLRFNKGQDYVVYAFDWQGKLGAGRCSRTGLTFDPRAGYQALVNGI